MRRCLECLSRQILRPDETIVVDASADDQTREVVATFADVVYLRNREGAGRMTTSRNISLHHCHGDVIAFLDDDAFAEPQWLKELLSTYIDTSIGGVGGRASNQVAGEESYRVSELGRLKSNGELAGYFAGDPGGVIEVDHVMGCNMSFRRSVLARLGGFREDYPGISGVCEDSDMCIRVRALGYRILFNPKAKVDHIGAKQAVGQRFDARYAFYGQRNHLVLLVRNFGFRFVGPYLLHSIWRDLRQFVGRFWRATKAVGYAFAIVMADAAGSVCGIVVGAALLRRYGREPARIDENGRKISEALEAERHPNAPQNFLHNVDNDVISNWESNGA